VNDRLTIAINVHSLHRVHLAKAGKPRFHAYNMRLRAARDKARMRDFET
jgi:hypothetical protein